MCLKFGFAVVRKHLPVPDDIEPVIDSRGALQGLRDDGSRELSINHFHELSLFVGRPTSFASVRARRRLSEVIILAHPGPPIARHRSPRCGRNVVRATT
jgi:hypothetical protein